MSMRARIGTVGLHAAIAAIVMAASIEAASAARSGALRGFVSYSSPSGDVTQGGNVLEGDSVTGWALTSELRGKRFGFEVGVNVTRYSLTIKSSSGPDLRQRAVLDQVSFDAGESKAFTVPVSFNVHLLPERPVDLYVGLFAQFTNWERFQGIYGSTDLDSNLGGGVTLGLDVPVGYSGFQFNLAARYMKLEMGNKTGSISLDPVLLDAGVGYRW